MNKKLTILALALICAGQTTQSYYGRGYGYGYGGGAWVAPAIIGAGLIAASAARSSDRRYERDRYRSERLRDRMDKTFWEITNNTGQSLRLKTRGRRGITVDSGETIRLGHPRSFNFRVRSLDDRTLRDEFASSDHHITILRDNNTGRLEIQTSNTGRSDRRPQFDNRRRNTNQRRFVDRW